MSTGQAASRSSTAPWNACRWLSLRRSGTAGRSNIYPWPGFKAKQEAARVNLSQAALLLAVSAPGIAFVALALSWLLGWIPYERLLSRITGVTFSASVFALLIVVWMLGSTGAPSVIVTFGNWFAAGDYHFPLVLMADRLPLPFHGLTAVLSGLIGKF